MQTWFVFKTLILQKTLKTQNQNQEEFCSHTFVPISWTCKKQTSISQSFTEAEVISLDAGLRMDGIPALDLWNLVVEVFHSFHNQRSETEGTGKPVA